jgi:hypothetical protein
MHPAIAAIVAIVCRLAGLDEVQTKFAAREEEATRKLTESYRLPKWDSESFSQK